MSESAVLLLNLGGPETLADVKPFLYRLFEDPGVLPIRWAPLRRAAAWGISTLREKKSQALYASIGGGSPIRRWTDLQAAGVESRLRAAGRPAFVRTAFMASAPLVEDVVKALSAQGVTRFLALPLYPQYSLTTTRGALDRARAAVDRFAPSASYAEIVSWPEEPLFIKAHADLVRREIERGPAEGVHIVFSAHSIPEKWVTERRDPYKAQMERTVRAIVTELGWKGPWTLAWQSRLGPIKWLGPSTPDVLRQLAGQGVRRVVIDPVAFVSDHVETLHEIDDEFRELAKDLGIDDFRRAPGLNDHPLFLDGLAGLVAAQPGFLAPASAPSAR